MSEFLAEAIPGIRDNSITNVIEVIGKVDKWCEHLLEGRDDVGHLVKKADDVSDFIRQALGYKESNTNRLRQCLRLERIHSFLIETHEDNRGMDILLLKLLLDKTKDKRKEVQDTIMGSQSVPKDECLKLNKISQEQFY